MVCRLAVVAFYFSLRFVRTAGKDALVVASRLHFLSAVVEVLVRERYGSGCASSGGQGLWRRQEGRGTQVASEPLAGAQVVVYSMADSYMEAHYHFSSPSAEVHASGG